MTAYSTTLLVSTVAAVERRWQHEPLTVGVPLPRSAVLDARRLALVDDDGRHVPLDASVLERWTDGSLRWVLLDLQVVGPVQDERVYTLTEMPQPAEGVAPAVQIDGAPDQIAVDTGAVRFVARPGTSFPFAQLTSGARAPIDTAASALVVTASDGRELPVQFSDVQVVHHGQLRATLQFEGAAGPAERPLVRVRATLDVFAGSSAVRAAITLHNPRPARHPGGIWELGDSGSVLLRGACVRIRLASSVRHVACAVTPDERARSVPPPVEIYQDSSGGERWNHVTHVNREGRVPASFRGYRLTTGDEVRHGHRATPALTLCLPDAVAGVAVEHFWQNCPAAIHVREQRLQLDLFPAQYDDLHELQGGEQKTFRSVWFFGDDASGRDARHWGVSPSIARLTPSGYAAADAIPFVSPACDDPDPRYHTLVSAALDGPASFACKRETIDQYGWRHFGDLYADHETVFCDDPPPVVSHYNNQYDAIAGFACQFMRTGDMRWFRAMHELALHVRDIDVYHTDGDKAAYNHGLFWHSAHYVAAGRSTHRSFPRDPRVHGGGPGNEHNYTAGLRLHWLMTGERLSRDTVLELAGWVLAMDDGNRTPLRWVCRSETGLASQTCSPDFHGPGRGAGHSVLALLDGHRVAGEYRYLAKAEQLIRRCIHPADDVNARQLLDVERRWSYTAFLQALGRYLDYKIELGELDGSYAYARASLLHYARWMAVRESPYLDRPEILEYPTETWAAQDMRKADVFLYAAGHSSGDERVRFLERARYFYEYSVNALLAADTRTLARPLVLMLSHGFLHMSGRAAADRPRPATVRNGYGCPSRFVPQKRRVRRRVVAAACLLASLLATGGIVLGDRVLTVVRGAVQGDDRADSQPPQRLLSAEPASQGGGSRRGH